MNSKTLLTMILVLACGIAAWAVNSSGYRVKKGEVVLGSVQVLVSHHR